MKRTWKYRIAAAAMTLLLVLGTGLVLHGQERYAPPDQLNVTNAQRSQVYVAGEGYHIDREQEERHQQQEDERQQQLEPKPPQPQPKPVTINRPSSSVVSSSGGSGFSGNGNSGTSTKKKPTKPSKKKPEDPGGKVPSQPEKSKLPTIKTSLKNGDQVKGTRLDFWVSATDGYGKNIPVFSEDDGSFTVICNGMELGSTGSSGGKTSFRTDLVEGRNEFTITATDRRGRTKTITRWITGKTTEKAETVGQVYVRIEAPVLNLGTFYEGYVEIINGDSAKDALKTAFDIAGIRGIFDGSYLEGISRPGIAAGAWISDDIKSVMEDLRQTEKDPDKQNPDRLKEKDFYESSGWIYIVNGDVPQVGLSSFSMEDGDELALVFSLADGVY